MTIYEAATVDAARALLPATGEAVVILPVYNSYDDVVRCYEQFFKHTLPEVPLLVIDDCGSDRRVVTVLDDYADANSPSRRVVVLRKPANGGVVKAWNDGFRAAGRSDVVTLNSDVFVGPQWLERLRSAAYSSTTIGTATALTNHGAIVSIGEGMKESTEIPGRHSVDEAATRVAAGSPTQRPRIPTAVTHCTYIKRVVIDAIGYLDETFSPGYGDEVDFSQRAIAAGFEHVAADDVFVYHKGGGSFGRSPAAQKLKEEHDRIVLDRYSYFGPWVHRAYADVASPLEASLLAARRALVGLHVAIDGMCLADGRMGTHVVVLETALAIADHADVSAVTLFTPAYVPEDVQAVIARNPKIALRPISSLTPWDGDRAHVVLRPYQLRSDGELEWLRTVASRVVVGWLDFIAFNNPAYFPGDREWLSYRERARLTFATADGISFLSRHVSETARAEGLVSDSLATRVVYCGTDHTVKAAAPATSPTCAAIIQPGFLFVVGVSYLHKNRLFALRILDELHALGWKGQLVLAGATPPYGSSTELEAALLTQNSHLAQSVVSLGPITEAEKSWFYANAGLVVYPTLSEGFGLVPFEAAHHGVPCLPSRMGSLAELLPADIAVIDAFDAGSAARKAHLLLTDRASAQQQIDRLLERASQYTWQRTIDETVSLLWEVTGRPKRRTTVILAEGGYVGATPTRKVSDAIRQRITRVSMFVNSRPNLRRRLAPPGSKREQIARSWVARA